MSVCAHDLQVSRVDLRAADAAAAVRAVVVARAAVVEAAVAVAVDAAVVPMRRRSGSLAPSSDAW
jgi:hypothetical protein